MASRQRQSVCRFYGSATGCRNGVSCRFLHVGEEAPKVQRLCKFFITPSGCRNGNRCRFTHDKNSLPKPNKPKQHQGKNKKCGHGSDDNNNNCKVDERMTKLEEITCGECSEVIKKSEEKTAYDLLVDHYLKQFTDLNEKHLKQMTIAVELLVSDFVCHACDKTFDLTDNEPCLAFMDHLTKGTKSNNGRTKKHKAQLEKMAKAFVERDCLVAIEKPEKKDEEKEVKEKSKGNTDDAGAIAESEICGDKNKSRVASSEPTETDKSGKINTSKEETDKPATVEETDKPATVNCDKNESAAEKVDCDKVENGDGDEIVGHIKTKKFLDLEKQVKKDVHGDENSDKSDDSDHCDCEDDEDDEDDENDDSWSDVSDDSISEKMTPFLKSLLLAICEPLEVEMLLGEDGEGDSEDDMHMGAMLSHLAKWENACHDNSDFEDEQEQRECNMGFTDDEVMELACQGIKPWESDAWDALDVLYDY